VHETRRPSERPPLLSLLGASGTGKTALATSLVARWTQAGLRVGYLKHASHGFEVDRPGKDTDRVASAGAAGVAVTGPGGFAYLERGEPRDPKDVVETLFADRDVVVLEGFRAHGFPAVVVAGEGDPGPALAEARGPVLALLVPAATAEVARAAGTVPVFGSGEGEALAAHLEVVLGLRSAGGDGAPPARARRLTPESRPSP
jgi:molybdopterin-guanine dinucleotide biosynthesis protein B